MPGIATASAGASQAFSRFRPRRCIVQAGPQMLAALMTRLVAGMSSPTLPAALSIRVYSGVVVPSTC